MGIGRMDQRVGITTVTQTGVDEIGGLITTKVRSATLWARVEQTGLNRSQDYMTSRSGTSYKITIRANGYDVTTDNLIEWDSKTLKIESVTKDEKHRYTIVLASSE